jgi:two-component system, cell cycle response regulator
MISLDDIRNARVLLVDDNADNVALLSELLEVMGYTRVSSTMDSRQVCTLHAQNDYDLILLDMHMPGLNGLDVMKQLKEVEKNAYLPVLAITGDHRLRLAALEAGARDFITKPYDLAELDMRMRNTIEVRLLYKAMAEQSRLQEERALHDSLTGLPNRRLLEDRIETAMQYARRHHQMMAVMYMDLDGFKQVNDQHGHACGDGLLKEVADRLRSVARKEDTVARIGGDEFIMVLCEISRVEDTVRPATRILDLLEAPFEIDGKSVRVSGSIGIAFYPTDAEDSEALIARADEALYSAKDAGKNRYQFAARPAFDATRAKAASNIGLQ